MATTGTQDAVIRLIMRYIGGSRLAPSSKLDVNGLKVATQATSLAGIASQLQQFGDTVEKVRENALVNPKANTVEATQKNLTNLKNKINNT